jgi:hypothetical protein
MRVSPTQPPTSVGQPQSQSCRSSNVGSISRVPSRANSFVDMSLLNTPPSSGLPSNVTHAGLMNLAASINGAVNMLANANVTASTTSNTNPSTGLPVIAGNLSTAAAAHNAAGAHGGGGQLQLEQTLRLVSGPCDLFSTQALIEEVQPAQPSRIWLTQQDVLALVGGWLPGGRAANRQPAFLLASTLPLPDFTLSLLLMGAGDLPWGGDDPVL